jgi:hypothetical protein
VFLVEEVLVLPPDEIALWNHALLSDLFERLSGEHLNYRELYPLNDLKFLARGVTPVRSSRPSLLIESLHLRLAPEESEGEVGDIDPLGVLGEDVLLHSNGEG